MSFLKLLAAGRSLIGIRETQSPYRMRTANLLPKFDSPKNPFAPKPKAEPANPTPLRAGAVAAASAQPSRAVSAPVKMETVSLFDAKPAAVPTPAKAVEPPPATAPVAKAATCDAPVASTVAVTPARKPVPLGEWVRKLNPMKLLPAQNQSGKKSLRAKAAQSPVQAELSLEKVKVVRNDLSDADLEVIPAKAVRLPNTTGLPDAAGPMMSMTRTQPTNWNRLTSSVAGTIQTMIR